MLAASLALHALMTSSVSAPPLPREFRAAWIASVANIDWPSKPGLSESEQQSEMTRILDQVDRMNMNAIIFQIRPTADAFYRSKLEPWSWFLSGEQGKGPSYDPLEFTIREAHARGIEVHVWFNPYRAFHNTQQGPATDSHVSKTHPQYVYRYGSFLWMDPGVKFVQDRSFAVMMDVLERYDIDGMHIDDYFYPYPVRENGRVVPFPDDKTYAAYRRRGGQLSLSDWRRKNVDDFVERLYDGIKDRKPWVKFGVSPFGIYRPGIPRGITAGVDQYEDLAADALKWWENGWLDYLAPQLYWPIEQRPQSFPVLLEWWKSTNKKNRHLWPGLFTSRLGDANTTYNPEQIVRQIRMTRDPEVNGHIHFSMKSFMLDWQGINDALEDNVYQQRALVPATPWLDARNPSTPSVSLNGTTLTFGRPENADVRFWAVQAQFADGWRLIEVTKAEAKAVDLGGKLQGASHVAVAAVDRVGNASTQRVFEVVR